MKIKLFTLTRFLLPKNLFKRYLFNVVKNKYIKESMFGKRNREHLLYEEIYATDDDNSGEISSIYCKCKGREELFIDFDDYVKLPISVRAMFSHELDDFDYRIDYIYTTKKLSYRNKEELEEKMDEVRGVLAINTVARVPLSKWCIRFPWSSKPNDCHKYDSPSHVILFKATGTKHGVMTGWEVK